MSSQDLAETFFRELCSYYPQLTSVMDDHLDVNEEILGHTLVAEMLGSLEKCEGFKREDMQVFFDVAEAYYKKDDNYLNDVLTSSFLEWVENDPIYFQMLGKTLRSRTVEETIRSRGPRGNGDPADSSR